MRKGKYERGRKDEEREGKRRDVIKEGKEVKRKGNEEEKMMKRGTGK